MSMQLLKRLRTISLGVVTTVDLLMSDPLRYGEPLYKGHCSYPILLELLFDLQDTQASLRAIEALILSVPCLEVPLCIE